MLGLLKPSVGTRNTPPVPSRFLATAQAVDQQWTTNYSALISRNRPKHWEQRQLYNDVHANAPAGTFTTRTRTTAVPS
jgi:hypothetical protein